jgi:FkbM family methyltransferase
MEVSQLSIKIGNFLYQQMFPIYNILYPVFKKRQDAVEISWIRRLVRPGSHVLDIGANIGFYTLLLSDLIGPKGHVHGFEPEAINFKHLAAVAGHRKNVTLVPKAVSDCSGELLMYTSPKLNVDHRTYRVENYKKVIAVDGVSIDDYVGGRFRVDFIKMDIQGYELHALRGMERTIGANPNIVIFSEFSPYAFKQCGTGLRFVYDYIRSLDLQVWLPEHDRLRPANRITLEQFQEMETVWYNVILSKQPIVNAQKVEAQVQSSVDSQP